MYLLLFVLSSRADVHRRFAACKLNLAVCAVIALLCASVPGTPP